MKATDILMQEHRIIERVLTALETGADRLEAGGTVDPQFFIEATEFIGGFADGCHHRKEEGVLFEAMNAAGMPKDSGPVAVMLAEHDQARAYTRGLREGAEKMQAGDSEAARQVIRNARSYAALLRQHIAKEDNVLFPMANGVIPTSEHARVLADFERLEHDETGEGVHEKFLALVDKLERRLQP